MKTQEAKSGRKIQKNTEDEAIKTALKSSRWILVGNRPDLSPMVLLKD